jgi:antirestriction protein ArdC
MNSYVQLVLDKIIDFLDKGVAPWAMTWDAAPRNGASKYRYSGANILLLSMTQMPSPEWYTYRQVKELGYTVRKGQKSTKIFFLKFIDDEQSNKKIPLYRVYNVFNRSQTTMPEITVHETKPTAEEVVNNFTTCPVVHYNSMCVYIPAEDTVGMPDINTFTSPEAYYQSFFHELIHSTGHPTRLHRFEVLERDKAKYSFEELVAEIGSCALMNEAGLTPQIEQTAAYCKGWSKYLKERKQELARAASQASRAINYILTGEDTYAKTETESGEAD